MDKLYKALQYEPYLFEKEDDYWTTNYLSKQNLVSELDQSNHLGSRGLKFAKQSVNWIRNTFYSEKAQYSALDLGCGSGITSKALADVGFNVTAIDISSDAIDYAKQTYKNIEFICGDYFNYNFKQKHFDLIYLGYCTLGMFNEEDRIKLLNICHDLLAPNGNLIFDVFSLYQFKNYCNYRIWETGEKRFWSVNNYIHFLNFIVYKDNNTFLDRHIIWENGKISSYNRWNHVFNQIEITELLKSCNYKNLHTFSNVCGETYCIDSKTIAIVAKI